MVAGGGPSAGGSVLVRDDERRVGFSLTLVKERNSPVYASPIRNHLIKFKCPQL